MVGLVCSWRQEKTQKSYGVSQPIYRPFCLVTGHKKYFLTKKKWDESFSFWVKANGWRKGFGAWKFDKHHKVDIRGTANEPFLMVNMFVRFWGTCMCNRPYGNILNQMRRNLYQRWVSFQHPPTTKEKLFIFLNQVYTVWY